MGTASFIADTGNLAVTTTSVPNYPFGHAFHFETDTGRQGVFGSKANDWNVKFDREALLTGALNIIIRLRIRTVINRNSKRRLEVFITKPIIKDKIMRTEWKGGNIHSQIA
jgi:hypothetical protein